LTECFLSLPDQSRPLSACLKAFVVVECSQVNLKIKLIHLFYLLKFTETDNGRR